MNDYMLYLVVFIIAVLADLDCSFERVQKFWLLELGKNFLLCINDRL